MAGGTIVVIDTAEESASAAAVADAAKRADWQVQLCAGAEEAIPCVQQLLASPTPPLALVFGADFPQPLPIARQLYRIDPLVQMIFLTRKGQDAQLRQSMGLAPRIGTYWSIVAIDDADLERLLSEATRSTQQRRQSRTTLDRVKLQIASRPPVDSPDYRRLVLSDRYLASILSHAQDAILSTEPGGEIITWNDAATRLFGYREQDVISRPMTMLARDGEIDQLAQMLQAARDGEMELRHEMRLCRADASLVDVELTMAPVLDENGKLLGISAIIRDVTDRKRAEEAIREQREWLQVTLRSIGDAVIATDTRGCVTFMNPIAEALTGWRQREAAGRPLEEVFVIVNEYTRQPVENPVSKVLEKGIIVGLANHTILIARNGKEWPIDDSAAPIRDSHGQMRGVVLVFHDVAERRRMEQELRDRAARLAEADRRKDEFLALLGHELRNPLAPLYNGLQILDLPELPAAVFQQTREMMKRQIGQLTRLVDDLLDVSRISRGILQLQIERVEVNTLVSRATETTGPLIKERDHQLSVNLSHEPIWLEGDPVRLEQILWNLLINAARYTEPGGKIIVSVRREGNSAVVQVSDTGIGIRREMLTRIFETFTQADRVEGRIHEGLGLGLTLVKNFAELHGGSVEAFSEGLGKGSTFVVRLPLSRETSPSPASEPAPATAPPSAALRVLIVDDNIAAAKTLGMLLKATGHEILTAHDGPAALELARSFHPQCIFLDIGLPGGMDGYEVARRMRQQPETKQTFLVALTGFGQDEDIRRAEEAGFNTHLVKPAPWESVQDILRRAAEHSPG